MASRTELEIGNVESRAKLSQWLGISIIITNCLGIAATLYVLTSLSNVLSERSGIEMLEQVRADYRSYQSMEKEARKRMETSRGLEGQISIDESEQAILSLSQTLTENERNYQIFFRLLKVNIYHLTNFIPGSYSWYEIWAPEIESAIERSKLRQRQLLEIQYFYEQRAQAA